MNNDYNNEWKFNATKENTACITLSLYCIITSIACMLWFSSSSPNFKGEKDVK